MRDTDASRMTPLAAPTKMAERGRFPFRLSLHAPRSQSNAPSSSVPLSQVYDYTPLYHKTLFVNLFYTSFVIKPYIIILFIPATGIESIAVMYNVTVNLRLLTKILKERSIHKSSLISNRNVDQ